MRQRAVEFLDRMQRNNGQADPEEIASLQAELVRLRGRGNGGLSPQEQERLTSLEETIAVLQDPEAMEALIEGYRDYLSGNYLAGAEAVRALRPG